MASGRNSDNKRARRGGTFQRASLSKSASQEMHALRAAQKRYGVDVGLLGMCEIRDQIQAGTSRCLEKQSHRVSIHEVQWGGASMIVAYDTSRKTLVTFLPSDFEPGVRPWRQGDLRTSAS